MRQNSTVAGHTATMATPAPQPSGLTGAASGTTNTTTTARGNRVFRYLSAAEMEERRRLGLCYNCDEKFSRNHSCKQLFCLLWDNEIQTEDEGPEIDMEPEISLHALTGVRTKDTMQLSVQVGSDKKALLALLDSGSTHNFISEEAARHLKLQLCPRDGFNVAVANGNRISCTGFSPKTVITIDTEQFAIDFYVISLGGYDVVLGTQWLATLGPILWDFGKRSMSFWRKDHRVTWLGNGSSTVVCARLNACDGSNLMELLIAEFEDIFSEPQGLPPRRS